MSLKQKLFVALFLVVQTFFLIPLIIYVPNKDEFGFGYASLAQQVVLPACAFYIGLVALLWICRGRLGVWTLAISSALSLCFYIQCNVLIWNYGLFDGVPIRWEEFNTRAIVDCSVWALIFLIAVVKRNWFSKRAHVICGLTCLLQFISSLPAIFNSDSSWLFPQIEKRTEQFSNLSKQRNAIVLLLDGFSSPAFSELIQAHPEYQTNFSDFVYFKNAISHFPSTMLSVPSILSGLVFDSTQSISDYLKNSLSKHSLPKALEENGFNVGVKTLRKFCHFLDIESCMGFTMGRHRSEQSQKLKEALEILDVSLFRALPQPLKRLVYRKQLWWLRRMRLPWDDKEAAQDPHLQFMNEFTEGLTVTEDEPVFRFVHILIPHYPVRFNAECQESENPIPINKRTYGAQAQCALKLAHQFVEKLKTLNVYDQSLVVIVADHGNELEYGLSDKNYRDQHKLFDYSRNLPLLLVKLPGAHHEFQISDVPASVSDIPRTVLETLKVENALHFGTSIFDLSSDNPRVRVARNIKLRLGMLGGGVESQNFEDFTSYKIQGDAWKQESWEAISSVTSP